jgi:ABC-2 type transport system ATP-binding protein
MWLGNMLEVIDIRKRYGSLTAVDGISLEAGKGEILGLLGPNGAGKTTSISIIAGLLGPDSGEVRIDGQPLAGDTDAAKRKLGLVPQEIALYDELTAGENLDLFGALYDIAARPLRHAIGEALELVGLSDRARQKVKTFSGGMKRRLNLAAALLHDPQVLLLDEPTAGVDPQSRNAIFDNLAALRGRGKTILYTTHYMEEAERLCDRLVVIDHGKVMAAGTLRDLYALLPAANLLAIELERPEAPLPLEELRALAGVRSLERSNGALKVGVSDLSLGTPAVLEWLTAHGHVCRHLASERATLETVFLTLTGRSLRD